MTPGRLAARVREITRGSLSRRQVDDIVAAAMAYAVLIREDKRIEQEQAPLCHQHETDLYPLIGVLAEALMPGMPQMAARRGPRGASAA